jgi:hypothetical protein
MPYINLLIHVPNETISTLNSECQLPTKVYESIQGCINLLEQIESGTTAASVQVTTLNNSISVSTDGNDVYGQPSLQDTYNHL